VLKEYLSYLIDHERTSAYISTAYVIRVKNIKPKT